MTANYLVCYDICEERRLAKVYRYLKQRGLHIQYSVFHCRLTWQELIELKKDINEIIDEKEDDVRIYPMPQDMEVTVMGCGDRIPEGIVLSL
ncbi:MAG: CRISPR-associated endonuclease Cas2 [Syntrophorhabdaceae bacterium]|jgi:CRISPR-associated protein Cas2|nr:CRISPR-associated endonuclease Cas2 [Syntrophorhabdaceae bacterium]MDD5242907.1 CRISPR-associated endonuclease Cas2 [Syntrophorhabdaceae bacterium]